MKQTYLYISTIVVLTFFPSCSEEASVDVDPEFLPYINLFEEEAQSRSVDISSRLENTSITFNDLGSDSAGQCLTYSDGRKEVQINQLKWPTYSEQEKEILIFHELGHCVLDREHDNNMSRGRCISIMRESSSTCIVDYTGERRSVYLDELFK